MISLLKYLKGYLRIRVWGFSPERFMNLCSNRNILIWDIVRDGEVYYMCISLKGFYQLRDIVRKTGTRVAICNRYGLPFFVPVMLARKVFLLGLFLTVGFWIWTSFFIWDIELQGNYQITEDIFQSFLKKNAVTVGMSKEQLNIETLEKSIRKEFPQITWTSAKLSGTKLYIDIKENDAPIIANIEEQENPMDLVAEYDGTVVSIIVRKGVPAVAVGDVITKGTVMVDGKVPVYNEDATVREYRYVKADADIVLEHVRYFRANLPFDYVQKEYTGRTKEKFFFRLGEKEVKMPENKPFAMYDSVIRTGRPFILEMLSVPIYWGSYTHREYLNVEYEYTLEEATALLNKKLNAFIITLEEKGVQIIEKDVKIDTSGGMWIVEGDFYVRELSGKSIDTVKPEISGETNTE